MPLYEYELCDGDCKACGGRFTLRRPLDAQPLTECPACRKPVRKIFSAFYAPKIFKKFSVNDATNAGFTVLKRLGKGEYETHRPKRNDPGASVKPPRAAKPRD